MGDRIYDREQDSSKGTLNEDGSLIVPVECIVEAVQSLGNKTLIDALEGLRTQQFLPMLESVESLVERVSEAKKRKIVNLTRAVQDAPSESEAEAHWQKLQHLMFGIRLLVPFDRIRARELTE